MRHYLATLHKRPEHHKKRFALLVSAVITLSIFTIWSVIHFQSSGSTTTAANGKQETSPLRALGSGFATALKALTSGKEEVKAGLEQVPTYGR